MVQGSRVSPDVSTSTSTITPTENDIYTAVGNWLLTVLPAGFKIMQGQQNFVPAPQSSYAVMEIVTRSRVATNSWSYTDNARIITTPMRIAMQIDVFGVGAGNAAGLVQGLWRDQYAVSIVRPVAGPIDTSEPRQSAFTNASGNYEDHWIIDLRMQCNFVTSVSQDFATSAVMTVTEADNSHGV